jgi:hypothetical protein
MYYREEYYLKQNDISNIDFVGGSEWLLEDTIELKNISVPDNHPEIDLNCIYSPSSPPNTLEFKDEDQQKGVIKWH